MKNNKIVLILAVFVLFNYLFQGCKSDNQKGSDSKNVSNIITTKIDSISDIDGNVYKTVSIGKQTWMAENLKVTKYSDGTPIPFVKGDSNWANLTNNDKAYCWLNDDSSHKETHGALYTYAAAINDTNMEISNQQGVCPTGWHLPSDSEWRILEDYITSNGYSGREGASLMSKSDWGNKGADNFGFKAIPGGYREESYGSFTWYENFASYWTSTQTNSKEAFYRGLISSKDKIQRWYFNKSCGMSVRCVMDYEKLTFSNDYLIGEFSTQKNGGSELKISKQGTNFVLMNKIDNKWAAEEKLTEMDEEQLIEKFGDNWMNIVCAALTSGICDYYRLQPGKKLGGITMGDQPDTEYLSRCLADNYLFKVK